jgi:plasmid stabilization system protein ParE
MRLTYHPKAEAELVAAAGYYEARVPTLGAQFIGAADTAVVLIAEAPDRWRKVASEVRRYPMPRFPYAICYRVLGDEVRILAFKHHRRHPDQWKGRMAD